MPAGIDEGAMVTPRKEKKKKTKKKKRSAHSGTEERAIEPTVAFGKKRKREEVTECIDVADSEKRKKKKRKKKREEDVGSVHTQEQPETKTKKKKKKKKKVSSNGATSTEMDVEASSGADVERVELTRGFNFYSQHSAVRGKSAEYARQFRKDKRIIMLEDGFDTTGSSSNEESAEDAAKSFEQAVKESDDRAREMLHPRLYNPIERFNESGLSADIIGECASFENTTPIQSQCIPLALAGRDVIGIAETGSGKTWAFMLPALHHVAEVGPVRLSKKKPRRDEPLPPRAAPRVVVIAPTRELAMQGSAVAQPAGAACGAKVVTVYGGVSKFEQRDEINGAVVVFATPGRLLDFARDGSISLAHTTYLVLDEADRMLDMGFEKDIKEIISYMPQCEKRQSLMFSATWPVEIRELAASFLWHPVRVVIGECTSAALTSNKRVTQEIEVLRPDQRDARIVELLRKYHKSQKNRILIFVLYKKEAPQLQRTLQRAGFRSVTAIHGDMTQAARTSALADFKAGRKPLLIATDVAARGLDIPDVEYVLNYSFPLTIEDYVHRIGRTGRGGKTGVSYTFFTQNDKARSGDLINLLRDADLEIPKELMAFGGGVKKKEHALYGAHFRKIDTSAKSSRITFDDDSD